ncbi:hypothetical protein GCM10028864_06590 [Microlunatus parietis]
MERQGLRCTVPALCWRTNVEVWCGSQQYFVDAAFVRLLLGIEVDGYAVHGQRGQFERDRQK